MKSTIMSFWLLCVTLGNLLVAFLAPLQKTIALSQFFWLFAALMAGRQSSSGSRKILQGQDLPSTRVAVPRNKR